MVKRVRIILDKACLASILGIRDEGNTATIDSNRKSVQENTIGAMRLLVITLGFILVRWIGDVFFIEVIFPTFYDVL